MRNYGVTTSELRCENYNLEAENKKKAKMIENNKFNKLCKIGDLLGNIVLYSVKLVDNPITNDNLTADERAVIVRAIALAKIENLQKIVALSETGIDIAIEENKKFISLENEDTILYLTVVRDLTRKLESNEIFANLSDFKEVSKLSAEMTLDVIMKKYTAMNNNLDLKTLKYLIGKGLLK